MSTRRTELEPKTVAQLEVMFKLSDDQVRAMSLKYAKKILNDNPPFATMKARLLRQKYAEKVAKAKLETRADIQRSSSEGSWKQFMGLRGVPIISVSHKADWELPSERELD